MCLATEHRTVAGASPPTTETGRNVRMSDLADHQAGTQSGCRHCTKVAYEPSWYASLLAFSQHGDTNHFEGATAFAS
jgi:hypothetical protein